ncbi:60S ribosomal protein L33-A [Zancudomyces culisetae]|uniref:60S ribosomal protein L33-A n=1 Tax=Zancudomyces culisetae TaxID=1213189 RepID=A0A1R1PY68_ZANCU|nr:60S ribosomal protein L33-A [Zancudomyces culisetae]|eukprot:OMH85911.1 60S ribosomal protein L33-A [Zancudomyces culisetae]
MNLYLTCRLYSKGRFLGYQRGKRMQDVNNALVKIEGVNTKKDTEFYMGKRVAYIYRAKREINGTKIRAIWGRVTRPHGNTGTVRAKFRTNLPPRAMGASLRIMLYPSRV